MSWKNARGRVAWVGFALLASAACNEDSAEDPRPVLAGARRSTEDECLELESRPPDDPPAEESVSTATSFWEGGPFPMGVSKKSIGERPERIEHSLELRNPVESSRPALRMGGGSDPTEGLFPEERIRWEWIGTTGRFELELVPERSEGPKKAFRLFGIEFPPDMEPWRTTRARIAGHVARALESRLVEVRRAGDGTYDLRTPEGSLGLCLLEEGLAWLSPEPGVPWTAEEWALHVEALAKAIQERRGLWESLDPGPGPWHLEGRLLHRTDGPCRPSPSSAAPMLPVYARESLWEAVGHGSAICPRCLLPRG